jgi:hypothetical protein
LSLLKTLRIAIRDISVVIMPAVCASLAGYFTLFSLTNLAIVCMFFKFPNLVALYFSRERQCFIFTSSVIIWRLHSFWRLDRKKKKWKIPHVCSVHDCILNMCILACAWIRNFIQSGLCCLYIMLHLTVWWMFCCII